MIYSADLLAVAKRIFWFGTPEEALEFPKRFPQGQHLQTLVEAQVAITDVLLKYVITCVVEPPEDALPAARVRARLRYDKLIRAAAKELSNKNRDTLRAMVVDY